MSMKKTKLRFRVPLESSAMTIGELLRRAWLQGTPEQIGALVEGLQVRADDRFVRHAEEVVPTDFVVETEVEPGEEVFGLPEGDALDWGEGWVVATKPTGMDGMPNHEDPMDSV